MKSIGLTGALALFCCSLAFSACGDSKKGGGGGGTGSGGDGGSSGDGGTAGNGGNAGDGGSGADGGSNGAGATGGMGGSSGDAGAAGEPGEAGAAGAGATDTGPVCEGTADACDSFDNSDDCLAQTGCAPVMGGCSPVIACGILPMASCEVQADCEWDADEEVCIVNSESACLAASQEADCAPGCSWSDLEFECVGEATSCESLDEADCSAQQGCSTP
jgi:hypothetical protein